MPPGDTIVAIATPLGRGGLGIVRLSGARARAVSEKLVRFRPAPAWQSWSAQLAELPDPGGHAVDQVVVTFFAGAAFLHRRRRGRDRLPRISGGSALLPGTRLPDGRAPGRARRIHAARVPERPPRSSAGRGRARPDRSAYAVSGARGGATGRTARSRAASRRSRNSCSS